MAEDPYKYFRIESRELLEQLGRGVLELDKAPDAALIARLLRFAHTLKGAARVVKQVQIAERTHALEELLLARREAQAPATADELKRLLELVDQLSALTLGLGPQRESAAGPGPVEETPRASARTAEEFESVRVDVEEVDALLRSVTEVGARVAALGRELGRFEQLANWVSVLGDLFSVRRAHDGSSSSIERARALVSDMAADLEELRKGATSGLEQVQRELLEVREAAQELRLAPVRALFAGLERVAHDAAQDLGKQAELSTFGGEVRLEAHVLTALREAFAHVVRNAVTHGIESPAQRAAAGKPARGRIEFRATRRGNRALFSCRDDGCGVDLAAVVRAAVARGLVTASAIQALSPREVTALLLKSGMSTSPKVSELAGRGIGLDVLSEAVTRLDGRVTIDSQPGLWTMVEVEVPISVALLDALLVEVADNVMGIPLDAIEQVVRFEDSEVTWSQGRSTLLHAGQALSYLPLSRVFAGSARTLPAQKACAVLLRSGDSRAAIGVERVVGTGAMVMRALPDVVVPDPIVAGAALDAEGNAELVLDPVGLVDLALSYESAVPANEDRAAPVPILVIDDSLTTRMLEQSILESAGYRVDLAVSAEEGLSKARAARYALFVVDVEMPGMNGFEFVAAIRADPELRATPAILVTSLDTAQDRRRGEEAGANAYIAKGEFDQGLLLRTISGLTG